MKNLIGKHFMAQPEIEKHKVLYSFKFGGGVKGGCVKSGDVIKVLDVYTQIDTPVAGTDKLLHSITVASLMNEKLFIQL